MRGSRAKRELCHDQRRRVAVGYQWQTISALCSGLPIGAGAYPYVQSADFWYRIPRAAYIPARKPFVSVSAFLVTRRRRHRHSHRRGCARLAGTVAFFSLRNAAYRCGRRFFCPLLPPGRPFALPFSGLVTTYATDSIRLSRSHHVIIHILTAASLPSLRPRARRGVPPSVLPAPYRPLMSPSLSMVVVLFVVFLPSSHPPTRRCGHPLCELTLSRPDSGGDFGVPRFHDFSGT